MTPKPNDKQGNAKQIIEAGKITAGGDVTIQQILKEVNNLIQVSPLILVFPLIIILGVLGAIQYVHVQNSRPSVMTGDFNIAIADFGYDDSETSAGTIFGDILFSTIEDEYEITNFELDYQIAHNNIGFIADYEDAELLAPQINADIVIFGTATVIEGQVQVIPKFYIPDSFRIDFEEIIGRHSLASPILFREDTFDELMPKTEEVTSRTSVVVNFVKALTFLVAEDYVSSGIAISAAIATSEELDISGREVLYVTATRVAIYDGDYDRAQGYIDTMLAINPNYGRAYLAQGNLYYAQGQDAYNNGNLELLDELLLQALTFYEIAILPENLSIETILLEKTYLNMGNLRFIQYQRAEEDTEREQFAMLALENYDEIISSFERSGNEHLQEMAAGASYTSGRIHQSMGDMNNAEIHFSQVIEHTENEDFCRVAYEALLVVNNEADVETIEEECSTS